MAIIKVQSVPLIPQPTDGVCWYVSARMCYRWSQATGTGSMTNPADDVGMHTRFLNNGDWSSDQNGILARTFKMKTFNGVSMDFDNLNSFFTSHGPIWTALQKNWGGHNFGHVVVICGVADTGVFINDPHPVGYGSQKWLTWDQINRAISSFPGGDFGFLTAA
jgi:hypothetical protein